MDVNEDAEILARLGILTSTERSPNKESPHLPPTSSSRFVDVNINGETVSDDSDDDHIFDRNSLLSVGSKKRERVTNNARSRGATDTPGCRYLLLMSSFFAAGLSMHSTPDVLHMALRADGHDLPIVHAAGLLLGGLFARAYVPRFNSMWLLFCCVSLLTFLAWLLLAPRDTMSIHLIVLAQGLCIATIKYAGISTWFVWWRSSPRKFFWLLFAFALGASIPFLIRQTSLMEDSRDGEVPRSQHVIGRRALVGTDSGVMQNGSDVLFVSTPPADETNDTSKPKKPDGAVGKQDVQTKTKQNEEERKPTDGAPDNSSIANFRNTQSESHITTPTAVVNVTSTTNAATSSRSTTTTVVNVASTTNAPTSSRTTTTTASTTTRSVRVPEGTSTVGGLENFGNKIGGMLPSVPHLFRVADRSAEEVVLLLLMFCCVMFLLSFILCCMTWAVIADSRVSKLSDHSCPGLSAGCRMRLSVSHCLSTLLHLALTMAASLEGDSYSLVGCTAAVLVSLLTVLVGPPACSLSMCWILVLLSVSGTVILYLSPASYLGFLLCTGAAPMISCILFMQVESRVCARPRLNIDIFLFSVFGARLALAVICYVVGRLSVEKVLLLSLLSAVFLLPSLFLTAASVWKAARLKEIYEFTSEHGGEPSNMSFRGESQYITLIEASDSETDEDQV